MNVLLMTLVAMLAQAIATSQEPAPAALRGVVVKWGSTEAVAQAALELRRVEQGPGGTLIATASLQNGAFQFSSVPPGRYRLIAVRAGYVQGEYGQRRPGGDGVPIALSAGQQMTGVRISMAPGATISGRITERNGQPAVRAMVQAMKVSYPEGRLAFRIVQSGLTNDLGEYRLFWMPPGPYYIGVRPNKEAATGGTIVANEKGGPYGWSSSPIASRTTARIPRAVGLSENETYLSVYYPGTPELQSATLIDLHAGEEIRDVNVNLVASPALRIRGTVTDPDTQQSAPNTTRVLLSPFSSPLATTTSALIGDVFQFGPLVPGIYEIRAEYGRSGRTIMGRAIVELRNRDLDVNVQVAGFNLSGRIISAGPTTGMQVILRSAPAFRIAGEISADGSFRIEGVPPGDYQVYVSSLEDAYVKTIRMGEADVLTRDLHIDAQPADQLQIVVAKDGGSVNGRVVNEQRGAVPNATVVLIPDGVRAPRLDQYKTASTGPSGEFLLGGIAPGAYNVFAWEDVDKDAWFDPNFLRLYRDFGRPVRVVEGANENIELRAIR